MIDLIYKESINKTFILTIQFLENIFDVWKHYDRYKQQYGNMPKLIEMMMQKLLSSKHKIILKEDSNV